MKTKGLVYLIGAGPGDPGLITIKGKECLEKADVVVYDYLVNSKLLGYAKEGAEIIYAGKRKGNTEVPQEFINQLLVDKAKEGKIVARLKGGDPFIFGRGGEEAETLFEAGIPFEIVNGVTSAFAVPAYAGIPITHRDFTSSFAVVTGHEDSTKEKSALPWEALSKIGTIVFLMGATRIEENMKNLIEHGKSPDTPAAFIAWGTLPIQKTVIGTIGDIGKIVKEQNIGPPAVIVVGEVVKLRSVLNWFETKPLFGKKIVVTRARSQASELTKLLEEQGAEVIEFSTIEIAPPASWEEMDRSINNLTTYDWIIFTSANGVFFFFERLKKNGKDARELKVIKIATIGEQTAEAVQNIGLKVDIIPDEFRAEGLIQSFKKMNVKGKRFLIPRAKEAREVLPQELQKMGAEVHVVTAYETKMPVTEKIKGLKGMLIRNEIDVVTFASSSTVRNFLLALGSDKKHLLGSTVACIGPITAETLREAGIKPKIVCKKYTIEELVREIVSYFIQESGVRSQKTK